MERSRNAVALRLALFYAAQLGTNGLLASFWPLWLALSLDPASLGTVLSVGYWVRVPASIAIARLADRRGEARPLALALALVALGGYGAFHFAHGIPAFFALTIVVSASFSPLLALIDTLTLKKVTSDGIDYGRVRLFGSIAFIVTTVGGGEILRRSSEALVLPLVLAGVALTLACATFLPDAKRAERKAQKSSLRAVLAAPRFVVFLLGCGFVHAGHSVYYAFGTLEFTRTGLSETTAGLLWAIGVIVEIVLFHYAKPVTARFSPPALLLAGALAGIVRWSVLATSPSLPVVCAVQTLHGLTYGASHLGAMSLLRTTVPEEHATTAQSVYIAVVGGIALGATSPLAGVLYEAHHAGAYWLSSALSFVSALLAVGLLLRPAR